MTVHAGPWTPTPRGRPPTSPARTRTGEILGMHTVAELADLVAAYSAMSAALLAKVACPGWAAADPAGYGAWAARVHDNTDKFGRLLATANGITQTVSFPNWTPIAHAQVGTTIWEDLVAWRKEFDALDAELRSHAALCAAPDYHDVPQPKAPDPDLKTYQAADSAAKAIEHGEDKVKNTLESTSLHVAVGAALALGVLFAVGARRR